MDASGWNVSDPSAHTSPADDDFQQFLDMNGMGGLGDGLQYDFHHLQNAAGSHLLQASSREQLDTPMSGSDAQAMVLSPADPFQQMPTITTAASFQTIPATMMPPPTPTEAIVDSIDAQIQFLQQQKLQHQQRQLEERRRQFEEQQAAFFARQQSRMVPPTPQSLKMQPGSGQFFPQASPADRQQQQPMDYRYQRLKDHQDMSFTPLVSPAVTPLDTHFAVDTQFTAVPGTYFSPLTSPALHAQTDPLALYEPRHGVVPTSSPVEMDLDSSLLPMPTLGVPADGAKKRKSSVKARGKSGVKQSPISRPMRRKTATTPNLNSLALNELVESAEQSQASQLLPKPLVPTSASSTTGPTDSEDGSVSPEALTDSAPVEMPPPPIPKPRSARPSPYIAPQTSGGSAPLPTAQRQVPSPATPASLMKLSSPNNSNRAVRSGSQEPVDTEHIELFELPESANFSQPAPTPAPVGSAARAQPSREDQPSKPRGFALPPSPSLERPSGTTSAAQSPLLAPGSSNVKKTPQLLPRGSKKRGSISSVHVSPALRPKISPNIKPLLPGGPGVEETASHLLATKSNYQRILEGNTVPGVSFPSELSTNLTSKRTSHKIAEQGRRNRINSALQEIATLLPKPPKDSGGEGEACEGEGSGDGKKDKANSIPNSKASTVEMAIEYIKQLQKEVAEANRRAEEAEKKLEMRATE